MIISNSSTLILLAKVSALRPFLDYVKSIAIPTKVHQEIKRKQSFEILLLQKEINKKRINVLEIEKARYTDTLNQFRLDEGEAAAYGLYHQEHATLMLTDDRELIKLCKLEEIPFINAMSVVVRLYQKKRITKQIAIQKLDDLFHHGWYSKELYYFFKSKVV